MLLFVNMLPAEARVIQISPQIAISLWVGSANSIARRERSSERARRYRGGSNGGGSYPTVYVVLSISVKLTLSKYVMFLLQITVLPVLTLYDRRKYA